ncbi:MAG: hypothetical protein JXR48_12320 [Candidatus Delongbacteria bacterium]|nr:hypothetical protein [Candidatus Delongbacteria bacterium]MBN2835737.1 hypothetical protein [Candidatus Delongbacteria bacterium]
MTYKLSNNTPFELTEENDLFNVFPKADFIREFLSTYYSENDSINNKMIALFGEWGTGKTTVMKYLEKELSEKVKFKTVFFEAWKYENDNDLSFSLIDVMTSELIGNENVKKILSSAYSLFKIAADATTISVPPYNFNLGKAVTRIEKELKKDINSISYHKKIENFKNNFIKLEDEILGKGDIFDTIKKDKKIVVFVDDLDRCEPENVLKLLSNIKHFMTYGERTIFFFGIDKKALDCALKTKYHNYLKSEEYLEKLFDISFEITGVSDSEKYIHEFMKEFDSNGKVSPYIVKLFNAIDFTTPRKVKKVMNKYSMIENYWNIGNEYKNLIPDLENTGDKNILNRILIIYFIVLFEYHRDKFYEIEDYEGKIATYKKGVLEDMRLTSGQVDNESATILVNNLKPFGDDKYLSLSHFKKIMKSYKSDSEFDIVKFLTVFLPNNNYLYIENNYQSSSKIESFLTKFTNKEDKRFISFCRFLYNNKELFDKCDTDYNIFNLFKMCRTLL